MRRHLRRLVFRLLLLFLLLCALFFSMRYKYRETVQELAQTQIKNNTSDLSNTAIARQIADGNIQYDRVVYFEKDINGKITALKTNIGEVNRLKTDMLRIINEQILALDQFDIGIPVGSLILPEFFSGKGPVIPVRILAIRNSDASFSSQFRQAGINQTLHQLIMNIQIDVSVLVLGQTESFSVNSQIVVAETIIIGDVPNTYLQSGETPDSLTDLKQQGLPFS